MIKIGVSLWMLAGLSVIQTSPVQAVKPTISLEKRANQSPLIVIGYVEKLHPFDTGRAIYTDVEFTVTEILKGTLSDLTLVVRVPGGQIDDTVQWVEGSPIFYPQESAVLFLGQSQAGRYKMGSFSNKRSQGRKWSGGIKETADMYRIREYIKGRADSILEQPAMLEGAGKALQTPTTPQITAVKPDSPIALDAFGEIQVWGSDLGLAVQNAEVQYRVRRRSPIQTGKCTSG